MSYPFTLALRIAWGDMDALGHVNNGVHIGWLESARVELFEQVLGPVRLEGVGPILASVSCDYLRPVVYPGTVVVGSKVATLGTTSFVLEHGLWLQGAPEVLVARARSVTVLVDYSRGNAKTPLPDGLRRKLEALQG